MYERAIKLIIESKIDQISHLAKAIYGICSSVIKDELLLYHLELCLTEAVTNVINHAYHRVPGNIIEVDVKLDEEHVVFKIQDSGDKCPPIRPKTSLDYDLNDISTLPESGMGLFIIYQIMDEVTFSQEQGKNVLVMKKKFTLPA